MARWVQYRAYRLNYSARTAPAHPPSEVRFASREVKGLPDSRGAQRRHRQVGQSPTIRIPDAMERLWRICKEDAEPRIAGINERSERLAVVSGDALCEEEVRLFDFIEHEQHLWCCLT